MGHELLEHMPFIFSVNFDLLPRIEETSRGTSLSTTVTGVIESSNFDEEEVHVTYNTK